MLGSGLTTSRATLLASLVEARPHPLEEPLAAWLASSRRFAAFVAAADTKIRKKLRTTLEPEGLDDLRLEFETAYLLLGERSLNLEYEPQKGGASRSPDFAVTFTTSIEFMVEVTRLRADPWGGADTHPEGPAGRRFADVVCRKLGQLQPLRGNLLVVATSGAPPDAATLDAAMLRVVRRAEAADPALVGRHGVRDRADFFRRYGWLSAVMVRGATLRPGERATFWANPQARLPLPGMVLTALVRSHTL